MVWNYRVVMTENDAGVSFDICEVYYDEDGNVDGWTDPVTVGGDDIEEARRTLDLMAEAIEKLVLSYVDLKRWP